MLPFNNNSGYFCWQKRDSGEQFSRVLEETDTVCTASLPLSAGDFVYRDDRMSKCDSHLFDV